MQSTLFEKDSLRFVPCRSQRGCDTRSAQRVNSDAPVVGIYDQTDFASADAKLCEAVCLHFSSRAEFVMTSTLPAFMDQRTDNRVQCVGDGEHDGDEVEHERECYIELDGAHHALGERDEVRQLRDFVVDERDIRGVHGDVAAHAAHCDADLDGLGGDSRFLSAQDDVRGLRCQMDELFDARGEVFADADRRDQRERDEHVCLDVERRDKADDGL